MRGPGLKFTACGCTHCLDKLNSAFATLILSPGAWSADEVEVLRMEANDHLLGETVAERVAPYTLRGDA